MAAIFPAFFFGLGAILASFVGVMAERAYTGGSWMGERSRCNTCARTLESRDLIPIFSWLAARGRCRTCKGRVPWLYTAIETALGALFVLAYLSLGASLSLIVALLFFVHLLFIVLYDLRHTVVPLVPAVVLVALGALFAALTAGSTEEFGGILLVSGCIGAFFFLLYVFSRGCAMGLGDAPVALALSLFAGSYALAGFLFSFWIGAVIGIGVLVSRPKGHRIGIEVPFVPFLAVGFLLAYFTQWNPFAPFM